MDTRESIRKAAVIRAAVQQGLLGDDNPVASFIDMEGLKSTVATLRSAFPGHFTHTFATKANSFVRVLEVLRAAGMGAEVASSAEFELACRAGFTPETIDFDAPVKTKRDIKKALELGVAINVDNFQELDRVSAFMAAKPSSSVIGIRINPQIGGGSVALSSTATETSKFGIGLKDEDNRALLIQIYKDRPWLTALHVHVGSVGCPLPLMCMGIAAIVDLAEEINAAIGQKQVKVIDMGGGLPVNFDSDLDSPTFEEYAKMLKQEAPLIFTGDYHVTTEFGRSIVAKNALTVALVEYTKVTGGQHIALTHAGAHNLVRVVFQPVDWRRRITAFDSGGIEKSGKRVPQNIAGPCCFAGDIIAHARPLPLLEPGDYVMIHDTGAYCFSNHFEYNAFPKAPVMGFILGEDEDVKFDLFKEGQSVNRVVAEYS